MAVHGGRGNLDLGPFAPFRAAWINRALIVRLTRREIEARYRGSALGLGWSVIVPLLMLLIYTFVFSIVFQARWDTAPQNRGEFALLLFSGLIAFNFMAECLLRAPGLMLENVSYIKKVVFPLEILPWVVTCVALFNAAVSVIVLAVFYAFILGVPPLTAAWAPLVVVPLVLVCFGLTCLLSSFGVFVRDIKQFVGVFTTILMFLSPIFYPISAVPPRVRPLLYANPLTILLEVSKDLLFWGRLPDHAQSAYVCIYLLAAWLLSWAGYVWFMKTKKGFADVV